MLFRLSDFRFSIMFLSLNIIIPLSYLLPSVFHIYIYIYIYIYIHTHTHTYNVSSLHSSKFPFQPMLKCLHVKSEGVWYLSFQEKHLSMGWYGNLDSSMVKSARLVIWRSVAQIPFQVQIFLLKI